jgi:hypothetical protein
MKFKNKLVVPNNKIKYVIDKNECVINNMATKTIVINNSLFDLNE